MPVHTASVKLGRPLFQEACLDNRVLPHPGKLIRAAGSNFHVQVLGEGNGPVLLCESGLTFCSTLWSWLAPELASGTRVFLYDRAGLGWSDEREGPRDASQIASELRTMLEEVLPETKLILVGHSMGALFNRAFLKVARQTILGAVWLDPAHPDQLRNRALRRRMRSFFFSLEAANLVASRNLPRLSMALLTQLRGLPPQAYRYTRFFFREGRHLRTSAREARAWDLSADFVRDTTLTDLPLLILSGQKHALPGWAELQKDLTTISSNTRHVTFTEASHLSLLAEREHARSVAQEIRGFLQTLPL